jgi:hypothetical protein
MLSRALATFERLHDPFWIAWTLFTRSIARVATGRTQLAALDLAGALRAFRDAGDVSGMVLGLAGLSSVLLAAGMEVPAYQVLAAAQQVVNATGLRLAVLGPNTEGTPSPDLATTDATLRAALDEGSRWSSAEALDRAVVFAEAAAAGPASSVASMEA